MQTGGSRQNNKVHGCLSSQEQETPLSTQQTQQQRRAKNTSEKKREKNNTEGYNKQNIKHVRQALASAVGKERMETS